MPLFKPQTEDGNFEELLREVLEHTGRTRKSKPKLDTSIRTYVTWFKLKHSFIQEIPGVPHLSLAKCSNPNCPNGTKPKGAIATVEGKDMCRECFISGYGTTTPK